MMSILNFGRVCPPKLDKINNTCYNELYSHQEEKTVVLSFIHTVVSAVLSIAIALASAGAAAEKPGVPAWDTEVFKANANKRNSITKVLTFGVRPPPPYGITFDERLAQAFDDLKAESGFDFIALADNVPDIFRYQRWLVKLFPAFFYKQRDKLLADRKDIWGILIGMPTKMHLKTTPTGGNPAEYHLVIEMTYADGSVVEYNSNNIYNTDTGDLGFHLGVFSLGFNFNFKEMYTYTSIKPPMNVFGYMKLYDILLLQNKAINAKTVRLKFPYKGKDWMLQIWKGRYFNTSGGEVGLYNKPANRRIEFYDAATEERIDMSFEAYVKETGQPLVVRPAVNHWWMTGFAFDKYVYLANQITLKTEITPADAEMMQGLIAALDREAAGSGMSYTVSGGGTTLLIEW